MNTARSIIDARNACMPLVRLLKQDGLTWSDRQEIADAIQDNLRVYRQHQDEMAHLNSPGETCAAQGAGMQLYGGLRKG